MISVFRDSSKKAEECRSNAYEGALKSFKEKNYEIAQDIFEKLGAYKDSSTYVVKCRTAILDQDYDVAFALKQEGRYTEAINAFQKLNGYKDSSVQIESCETAIKDNEYNAAVALMDANKYSDAISAFEILDGYKDSASMIEACQTAIKDADYDAALALLDAGEYSEAITAFQKIYGYKESEEKINICVSAIRNSISIPEKIDFITVENKENKDMAKSHEYWLIAEDISWTEAEEKCRIMGGHLVVISDSEELNRVITMATKNGIEKVWVGCHREYDQSSSRLIWENNETVDFYVWGRGEPSYYNSADRIEEDYLLLERIKGTWVYCDSRNNPVRDYPVMYSGIIGYVCEFEEQ